MVQPLEAYKGGSTPWGISDLPPSPPVFPSTIMGTHTSTTSLYVQPGSHPHPRCHVEDCLWMLSLKGVGPLVRSWGEFRNTLGSLRPLSGFFLTFPNTFFQLFLNFFLTFLNLFSNLTLTCTYMFFPSFSWPLGAWPKGGGTVTTHDRLCHMSHLSWLCDTF